nr:MAG: hypothetical protein DIU74_13195 [Pseudomonadota bacterium]
MFGFDGGLWFDVGLADWFGADEFSAMFLLSALRSCVSWERLMFSSGPPASARESCPTIWTPSPGLAAAAGTATLAA